MVARVPLFLVAAALVLASCSRNPGISAPAVDPYGRLFSIELLEGHVLTDDGWPLANARVAFRSMAWPPMPPQVVRTRPDGRFTARELVEGAWAVDVSCSMPCAAAGPQPSAPLERFQPLRATFDLRALRLPILTFVMPTLRHPLAVMFGDDAISGVDLDLVDRLARDVLVAGEDGRVADALLPSAALLARFPDMAGYWRPIARAHLAAGRRRLAVEAYDRYLEARPDDLPVQFERARARLSVGLLDPADLDLLRSAAEAGEAPPEDLYNLGQVAFAREDAAGARRWFELALRARPGWVPVVYQLGMVAMNQGDMATACRHLRDVVILDPSGSFGQDSRLNLEYLPCPVQ